MRKTLRFLLRRSSIYYSLFTIHSNHSNEGFTLLELVVASGIFAMVALVGFATLSNVRLVDQKTQTQRAVSQTARFSLEAIAREVRTANGFVALSSTGEVTRTAGPFTILSAAGTPASVVVGDSRLLGPELQIATTDLVTGIQHVRIIQSVSETQAGRTHQFVTMTSCLDIQCATSPPEVARLTPQSVEVTNLSFTGLAPGSTTDRQPFVQIDLTVKATGASGKTEEVAEQTVRTVVTARDSFANLAIANPTGGTPLDLGSVGTGGKTSTTSSFTDSLVDANKVNATLTTATIVNGQAQGAINSSSTDLSSKIGTAWTNYTGRVTTAYDTAHNRVYLGGASGKFGFYNPVTNTITDLTSKMPVGWGTNDIRTMAIDQAGLNLYLGGAGGKFARYNFTANTVADLTSSISSFWSIFSLNDIIFDKNETNLYLVGDLGKFAKFTISTGAGTNLASSISFWSSSRVVALTLIPNSNIIYLAGQTGKFARFDTVSNTGTDLTTKISTIINNSNTIQDLATDATGASVYLAGTNGKFVKFVTASDTPTDLTTKLSSSIGTTQILTLLFDGNANAIYIGADTAKFARYNVTPNSAVSLSSKISSFWGSTTTVVSLSFDKTRNVVFMGSLNNDGRLARYNTPSYNSEGLFPAADTAFNHTSALLNVWATTTKIQPVVTAAPGTIFMGGTGGKFGKYIAVSDSFIDLTSGISSLVGTSNVTALAFDSTGNTVYIGTSNGSFIKYSVASDIPTNETSKISGFWSTAGMNALAFDAANGVVYLGGNANGANPTFAKYVVSDGTATDLSSKILSFWSNKNVLSLGVDSTNAVIYLGGVNNGTGPSFAKYLPVSNTATSLAAQIPFWGSNWIYGLAFDTTNKTMYLAGSSGKFGRYQPSIDTAADLTSQISTFWGTGSTSDVLSLAFDSSGTAIYLGGSRQLGGVLKFAVYKPATNTATNLVSQVSSFWGSVNTIYGLASDPQNGNTTIYLGGQNTIIGSSANLARYSETIQSPSTVQSTAVDTTTDAIFSATLSAHDTPGTGTMTYQLSNDNGAHFTTVTSGTRLDFPTNGSDLIWKVMLTGNASLQDLTISYTH